MTSPVAHLLATLSVANSKSNSRPLLHRPHLKTRSIPVLPCMERSIFGRLVMLKWCNKLRITEQEGDPLLPLPKLYFLSRYRSLPLFLLPLPLPLTLPLALPHPSPFLSLFLSLSQTLHSFLYFLQPKPTDEALLQKPPLQAVRLRFLQKSKSVESIQTKPISDEDQDRRKERINVYNVNRERYGVGRGEDRRR